MKYIPIVAAILLSACSHNFLDGKDYGYLPGLVCQPDGSTIVAQQKNSAGNNTPPRETETVNNCTPAASYADRWPILIQSREAKARHRELLPETRPK